jgi:hypothetical protein
MMKYVKRLTLTTAAVGAFAMLFGAGTASATALCEATPASGTDCPTSVAQGTVFHFTEDKTSFLMKTSGGTTTFTCTESTIRGTTENIGSTTETVKIGLDETLDEAHLTGHRTGFGFDNCNTTVTTLRAGTLEIHKIAGTDNGTITSTGTEITFKFLGVSCILKTNNTDIGTFTGSVSAPTTFDINGSIPIVTGGLCPATGIWTGNYIQTAPTTTFSIVASG